MERFQKRFYMFLFIFIAFIGIDLLLQKMFLYKKDYFKLNENVTNVILGHSHVEYGYNTKFIKNAINLGSSGEAYIYTYFKAKKLIKSNPQIRRIFIEFTNNQIEQEMDNWMWDDTHLQYQLDNYLFLIDYEDLIFLYNKNTKGFQSAISKTLFNNLDKILINRNIHDGGIGGYQEKNKKNKDESDLNLIKKDSLNRLKISNYNILYLKKLVNLCNEKKIKVFFVRSPMSHNYSVVKTEKLYRNILTNKFKNIKYLDFKNYPLLDSDFLDNEHLNKQGAEKYSIFFNDTIYNIK